MEPAPVDLSEVISYYNAAVAGLPDAYLDAGALPTLHDRCGISLEALARRIKGWLG